MGQTAIDELDAIEVNCTKQWLLYRGNDISKPVVLFVHGGPGSPLMMYSRAFDGAFIDDFVIVHWDQRGSGKSFNPKTTATEQYTIRQFVDDGFVVTEHLRRKFHRDKIVLVAHSWGTILALQMAAEHPEYFQSLVAVGTMSDVKKQEEYRYRKLKKAIEASGDVAAAKALSDLGPPPFSTHTKLSRFGDLLLKFVGFGGVFHHLTIEQVAEAVTKNREYTSTAMTRSFKGLKVVLDRLAPSYNSYVALEAVPMLEVPVYLVQGQYDFNTPTPVVKEYFDGLHARKGKTWIVFEDSAHFPFYENPNRFRDVLLKAIKGTP